MEVTQFIKGKVREYMKVTFSAFVFPDGTYEQCQDYITYGKEQLGNKRYLHGEEQLVVYEERTKEIQNIQDEILSGNGLSSDFYRLSEVSNLEQERIDILAEEMKKAQLLMKECRRIFTEYVYNVSALFRRTGGTLKGFEEYVGCDVLKNMQELESLEHVICWFADFKKKADQYMKDCISRQKRSEIETAMRYIHENYNLPLNLKEVAEKAGLSTAYFSTVFKKENGKSFVEYLTELRVEHAKGFLQNKDACVYEVGEQVGYPDPNYFSKIFRKAVGLSPEKYRRQILEETE